MTATPVFNSARFEPARREAAAVAEGRAIIAKRFGAAAFKKCFGVEPAKTMAPPAKAAAATPARAASTITAKAPTRPTAPVEPARKNYTLHRYACKNWLPTLA